MSSASGGEGSAESAYGWNEWQQQLQAYIVWVNSQLKKKPGSSLVKDISTDMADGTALANLISIVAGENIDGINQSPTTLMEMKENNDRVLHFMRTKRIRMHQTSSKDVVEGNIKVIMRLILALAARYKPSSVKQTAVSSSRSFDSMAEMAQGASTALARAKQAATISTSRPQRPRLSNTNFSGTRLLGSGSESSDQASKRSVDDDRLPGRDGGGGASSGDSHYASTFASPHSSSSTGSPPRHRRQRGLVNGGSKEHRRGNFPKSRSEQVLSGATVESAIVADAPTSSGSFLSDSILQQSLNEEHETMGQEINATRQILLSLQNLLLNGECNNGVENSVCSSGDENECLPIEGSTPQECLTVMKSRLQNSEITCQGLKNQVQSMKSELVELQGQKRGLQARLEHHEDAMLKMRAELLRVGFALQGLQNEKEELENTLREKQQQLHDLRRELIYKDRSLDELVANVQIEQNDKAETTRGLRGEIQELHERLRKVSEKEANLTNQVVEQDKHMNKLESKILQTAGHNSGPSSVRSNQSAESDELYRVRTSLRNLKTSFAKDDTAHRTTIDVLEQSITALMDRLDLTNERFQNSGRYIEDHRDHHNSSRSKSNSRHHSIDNDPSLPSTKVLYFTDKTVTPYMCTIAKRLGEITLADLRRALDKHGRCRFHFKALDPEFGTVKEELCHDDDIIPGWEGRIVTWLEED